MRPLAKRPELIVILAAAAWGLFWMPLRALAAQGLAAGWAPFSQFFAPLLVLLPFAVWRGCHGRFTGVRHWQVGLFVGGAVALYLQSLLLTDVARALILFYAMPAWGTLLEIGVMGRALTRWRAISLLLSVAGLLIILGVGQGTAVNAGDILALLSGMLFAVGAMVVRQEGGGTAVFPQLFAFFLYGSLTTLLLSQLPLAELGHPPALPLIIKLLPLLFLLAIFFLIPVMWGVFWGSAQVDPGRLGILLQIEAVVGIGSAALFAGEPFGIQQAVGGVFVIGAGLAEVMKNGSASTVMAEGIGVSHE